MFNNHSIQTNQLLLIKRQEVDQINETIQSPTNPNLEFNTSIPTTFINNSIRLTHSQSHSITSTSTDDQQLSLSLSLSLSSTLTFIPTSYSTSTSDLSNSLFPTSTPTLLIPTSSSIPFSSPTFTFIPTSTSSFIPTSTSIQTTSSITTTQFTSTSTSTTLTSTTQLFTFTSTQTFTTHLISTQTLSSISHILSSQADGSIQTITTLVPFTQLTSISTVLLKPTQVTNPNLNGSNSNSSNHLLSNTGALVGVILGIGIALIIAIGSAIFLILKRKRSRDQQREFEDELQMGSDFGDHGLYHDHTLDFDQTHPHLNHQRALNSAHSDQFLISPIQDFKSSNQNFWGLNGGFSLENQQEQQVEDSRRLQDPSDSNLLHSPTYSHPYFGSDQTHPNTLTYQPGPTWPESSSSPPLHLLNGYTSHDPHHLNPNPNPIALSARRKNSSPQPFLNPSPSTSIDHSNPQLQEMDAIDPILLNLNSPNQILENENRTSFYNEDRSSTPRPNLNTLQGYQRHQSFSTLEPPINRSNQLDSLVESEHSIGNFVTQQRRVPIDSQLSTITFDESNRATMTTEEWRNYISHFGPRASLIDESNEFHSPLFSEETSGEREEDEDELNDHRLRSYDHGFDDRLNRNVLNRFSNTNRNRNDQEVDELSLRDETDYSRRILTVSNPDNED